MRAQYYLPASGQSILSHLQCSKHNMWRQGETPGSFVTLLPNQRSGPGTILGTALHPMTEWLAFPNYSGSDIEIPHRSWSVVVASANRVKGRRFYLLLVAFLQNPARRGQSFSRYNPL